MRRNRLHHAKFLRDKLSHFGEPPTPAECLAGVLAIRDVLNDHEVSQESLLPLTTIVDELRCILRLGNGESKTVCVGRCMMARLVSGLGLLEFATTAGKELRSHWHPAETAPALPMEIADICKALSDPDGKHAAARPGHNQHLRRWGAYWTWDYASVREDLECLRLLRRCLNHEPHTVDLAMSEQMLTGAAQLLDALNLRRGTLDLLLSTLESIPGPLAGQQHVTPGHGTAVGVCRQQLSTLESIRSSRLEPVNVTCAAPADGLERGELLPVTIPVNVTCGLDPDALRVRVGWCQQRALVGRADLVGAVAGSVLEALRRGEASRIALTGPSGIGKTAAAQAVCEALQDVLPFQLLLLCVSRGSMMLELARLGRAFAPGVPRDADEEDAAAGFLTFLRESTGWLLMMDDCVDLDAVAGLLPADADGRAVGHVLLTSQRPWDLWAEAVRLTGGHIVGPLATDQSMELLRARRNDRPVKEEVLTDGGAGVRGFVEQVLGNHPLAVAMLKGALQGKDLAQARTTMEALRVRFVGRRLGEPRADCYLRSLPDLVRVVLQRLEERCVADGGLRDAAHRLLAMLCVLDRNGAPDELFVAASGSGGRDGWLGCPQWEETEESEVHLAHFCDGCSMCPLIGSRYRCTVCSEYDLCEACVGNGVHSAENHKLERVAVSRPKAPATLFEANLFARAKEALVEVGLVGLCKEGGWTSMHALYQLCVFNHLTAGRAVSLPEWGALWKTLQRRFVDADKTHLRSAEFASLYSSAAALAEQGCSGMASAADTCLDPLRGDSGAAQGRVELEPVSLWKLLTALGGLARTMTRDWAAGELYLVRALRMSEAMLGEDHAFTAMSAGNLGALLQGMGRLKAARPLLERAVQINVAVLGPDHKSTAASIDNLGCLLYSIGLLDDAHPLLQEALRIRKERLGPDHPETAVSIGNVGALLRAMGRLEEALPLYELALKIDEARLGPDHPSTTASVGNLGGLLRAMGRLEEALPLLERAVCASEAALGADHPSTAVCVGNLGCLLYDLGRLADAQPLYERVLAIREAQLGPQHPETAVSVSNLGMLLEDCGRLEEARALYERALAIREAQLAPNHAHIAVSVGTLGCLLQAMGLCEEARALYERAVAVHERHAGPDHPDTAKSINNLAHLLVVLGRAGEALPLYQRVLRIRESRLGPDHIDTATSLNNLGHVLSFMGRPTEAEPMYLRSLRTREARLGPDDPATAGTARSLGRLLRDLGRPVEAAPLYTRALRACEARLGPDHPDTAAIAGDLSEVLRGTAGDLSEVLRGTAGDLSEVLAAAGRAAPLLEKVKPEV